MTFLEWTFASFWRFAGVVILLAIAIDGLCNLARAMRGPANRLK